MAFVEVNGELDKALSRFRKKVQRASALRDYKRRQRFEKPSTVRRMNRRAAELRRRRE